MNVEQAKTSLKLEVIASLLVSYTELEAKLYQELREIDRSEFALWDTIEHRINELNEQTMDKLLAILESSGTIGENPYFAETNFVKRLSYLPEPLRSQMLNRK